MAAYLLCKIDLLVDQVSFLYLSLHFFYVILSFIISILFFFLFLFLWVYFWGAKNDRYPESILIYSALRFRLFSEFTWPLMSQLHSSLHRDVFTLWCHVLQKTMSPSFWNCLTIDDIILTSLIALYFISYFGCFPTGWEYLQIPYQFVTRRKDNKIVNASTSIFHS